MEIQLTEFLIDTVEKLLRIVRQQNNTLAQLGAVAAYSAAVYPGGKEVDKANVD